MSTAHISERNHLNIEAIKLIVACDLCPKSCVQYAKLRTVNCDVNRRIKGHTPALHFCIKNTMISCDLISSYVY